MDTSYPSRVDSWLAATLIGTPVVMVSLGAFVLTRSVGAGLFLMLTGAVVGVVIGALSIPCRYTLTDGHLLIKSGLLEDEVPLAQIHGAERVISAWSAPALSVRRVKIILAEGTREISPQDRDGFMSDLDARLKTTKSG